MMHQRLIRIEHLPSSNHYIVDEYELKFTILPQRRVYAQNNYLLRMSSARESELPLETCVGDYLSLLSLAELSVDVFRLTHKAEMTSGPAGLRLQDKTVGVLLDWLLST